tara:strand:- start:6605 stop:7234 length:630 start_codon:yes stop_codon:yes gene_type:complete
MKIHTAVEGLVNGQQRHATNVLRTNSTIAQDETVLIGADTWTFKTSPSLAFEVQDGVVGVAVPALLAAINSESTENVTAVRVNDNITLLMIDAVGDKQVACTETMAGTTNEFVAAAFNSGTAPSLDGDIQNIAGAVIVPTAADIATAGLVILAFAFAPTIVTATVRTTSTGATVAWDGAITQSGRLIILDNGGATDFAATDEIHVIAMG